MDRPLFVLVKAVSVKISNGDLDRDLESDLSSLVSDEDEEDDVAKLTLLVLVSDATAEGAIGAIDLILELANTDDASLSAAVV